MQANLRPEDINVNLKFLTEQNLRIAKENHEKQESIRRGTKWRMIQLAWDADVPIYDRQICRDIRECAPKEAFENLGVGVMIKPGFSMKQKGPGEREWRFTA